MRAIFSPLLLLLLCLPALFFFLLLTLAPRSLLLLALICPLASCRRAAFHQEEHAMANCDMCLGTERFHRNLVICIGSKVHPPPTVTHWRRNHQAPGLSLHAC